MKRAIILIIALFWLTPQAVADKCAAEASFAVRECSCTVVNRIAAGWSERRVLSAYYAPSVTATSAQVAVAAAVLDGSASCDPALYFAYSDADVRYLHYEAYTPALVVCAGDKCVQLYDRWFRREQ